MTAGQQVAVVARVLRLDRAALAAAWPHIQRGEVPPAHRPVVRELAASLRGLLGEAEPLRPVRFAALLSAELN